MDRNRLIILTGPSCVGKTPLEKSLRHFYPDLSERLKRLVAYNSRTPRPMEQEGIDYYFRTTRQLNELVNHDQITLIEARGDLHGFDIDELKSILIKTDAFYEGNTFVAKKLVSMANNNSIFVQSIFLSPFSRSELEALKRKFNHVIMEKYVYDHMFSKLIRRAQNFRIELTDKVMDNLRHRARDAWYELKEACLFDHVIVNHIGEDSRDWNDIENLKGDSLNAVHTLAGLISRGTIEGTEDWHNFQLSKNT